MSLFVVRTSLRKQHQKYIDENRHAHLRIGISDGYRESVRLGICETSEGQCKVAIKCDKARIKLHTVPKTLTIYEHRVQ